MRCTLWRIGTSFSVVLMSGGNNVVCALILFLLRYSTSTNINQYLDLKIYRQANQTNILVYEKL